MDAECQNACVDATDQEARGLLSDLFDCVNEARCADVESCIESCPDEATACIDDVAGGAGDAGGFGG